MVAAAVPELDIRIHDLIDPKKCYDFLRLRRWPHGVCSLKCTSNRVKKNGHKRSDPLCQRYKCNNCRSRFDDFTGTILSKTASSYQCLDRHALSHGPQHVQ
jgi:hypothetical protein